MVSVTSSSSVGSESAANEFKKLLKEHEDMLRKESEEAVKSLTDDVEKVAASIQGMETSLTDLKTVL